MADDHDVDMRLFLLAVWPVSKAAPARQADREPTRKSLRDPALEKMAMDSDLPHFDGFWWCV